MTVVNRVLICVACKKSYEVRYIINDTHVEQLNEYRGDDCPHCEAEGK